jgi:hypothetical protein
VSDFLYEMGWDSCVDMSSAAQCVLCACLTLCSSKRDHFKGNSPSDSVIRILCVLALWYLSFFVASPVELVNDSSRSARANGQCDVSVAVMIDRGRLIAVVKNVLADIHIIIHSHSHSV